MEEDDKFLASKILVEFENKCAYYSGLVIGVIAGAAFIIVLVDKGLWWCK